MNINMKTITTPTTILSFQDYEKIKNKNRYLESENELLNIEIRYLIKEQEEIIFEKKQMKNEIESWTTRYYNVHRQINYAIPAGRKVIEKLQNARLYLTSELKRSQERVLQLEDQLKEVQQSNSKPTQPFHQQQTHTKNNDELSDQDSGMSTMESSGSSVTTSTVSVLQTRVGVRKTTRKQSIQKHLTMVKRMKEEEKQQKIRILEEKEIKRQRMRQERLAQDNEMARKSQRIKTQFTIKSQVESRKRMEEKEHLQKLQKLEDKEIKRQRMRQERVAREQEMANEARRMKSLLTSKSHLESRKRMEEKEREDKLRKLEEKEQRRTKMRQERERKEQAMKKRPPKSTK
jgi:hypothetical protein